MSARKADLESFLKWVEVAHYPHGQELAQACREEFEAIDPDPREFFVTYRRVRDRVFHQYDRAINTHGQAPCNT